MYLASFETPSLKVLQGCVRLGPLLSTPVQRADAWWSTLIGLIGNHVTVPGVNVALRLVLKEGSQMIRRLVVSAPQASEPELRRYLGTFARLENVIQGSVGLPTTREEHDGLLDRFPEFRCHSAMPFYGSDTAWFACDYRLAPILGAVFEDAAAQGYGLGYQVHLRQWRASPEANREARKNGLRVQDLPGIPETLRQMQYKLAEGLAKASFLCEEFIAVDTTAAARWLEGVLRSDFELRYGPLRFEAPDFEFEAGFQNDLLMLAAHSSLFVDETRVSELCSAAIDGEESQTILGWRPTADLAASFTIGATDARQSISKPRRSWAEVRSLLPDAYEGNGDFVFLSYKHQDIESIAPVLKHLDEHGVRVWYDKGIPGGSEWDALIEEKLERCQLLLVFMSPLAVGSKHVRREVKYADALDKQILCVQLEDTELTHGLAMLLTQYQVLDATASDFRSELNRALRSLELNVF
jgi:TIR domain-containing protein